LCKHILNIGCTLQPNFADGCLTIEIINVLSASENPEIKRGLRFLFVHEDGVLVDTIKTKTLTLFTIYIDKPYIILLTLYYRLF